ncbi:hypothetical protein B0T13DRAFT_460417 [Neurospora crassa]|nr:hypothetical protein B0T13DRAFT_460417 [Neurospora crassa]
MSGKPRSRCHRSERKIATPPFLTASEEISSRQRTTHVSRLVPSISKTSLPLHLVRTRYVSIQGQNRELWYLFGLVPRTGRYLLPWTSKQQAAYRICDMPLPGYMTKQLSETRRQDVLRVRMQYPSRDITSIAVLSLSLRFLEVFLFWFIRFCWYLAVASPSFCPVLSSGGFGPWRYQRMVRSPAKYVTQSSPR